MSKYSRAGLIGKTAHDLEWMAGSWKGNYKNDIVEEHWSKVGGGTMMGMFRWQTNDAIRFYELMIIEPDGEHVYLRLKHFHPALKGWEEKDECKEFLLVQLEEKKAIFLQVDKPDAPWIIYELQADDCLLSYFEKEDEAHHLDDKFVYHLQI